MEMITAASIDKGLRCITARTFVNGLYGNKVRELVAF